MFLSWFAKYVLKGNTYETLTSWSRYSLSKLERNFQALLKEHPPSLTIPQPNTGEEAYLILDAIWFGKRYCLMLYRQSRSKVILYASFMVKEWGSLIAKDLRLLKEKGYCFTAVVSDGGTGIRKAITHVFGHIPHQICLAHLHRQCVAGMGRRPKDERVRELKRIADHLWLIESKEALKWWKTWLQDWIERNRRFLRERKWDHLGNSWFIHAGVRKAVRILVSAPDTSFKFLDRPLLPKTTNELEGQISNLSTKHLIHRGLRRDRVQPFLRWFVYFYNRNLLSQRKTKED